MISLDAYFGQHPGDAPSAATKANALSLIARVNTLLIGLPPEIECAHKPIVNSGWRPAWFNATVPGAAPKSKHITGEAIDLADPEGELDEFLFRHPQRLIDHDLWLEHPSSTRRWTHLQSVPPRSGNRIFFP